LDRIWFEIINDGLSLFGEETSWRGDILGGFGAHGWNGGKWRFLKKYTWIQLEF